MSTKKFSLSDTPVKRIINGKEYLLYRIMAEKSFDTFLAHVNKGEFGGLVSSEKTLSQESVCWIFPNAAVVENAVVKNEAVIAGRATIT